MHIAEHCITDLASALAVAKALGRNYVAVPKKAYPSLWAAHSGRPYDPSANAWFHCRGVAIICYNSDDYVRLVKRMHIKSNKGEMVP